MATVVRNAASTIEATIFSVATQTYPSIEYIVIDGQSTDGTIDILKRHNNDITSWISESDKGIYDAMNKALMIANGRWIIFLGSDDVFFDKNVLENISKKLRNDMTIYYGDVELKSTGKIYCGKMNTYKLMQQNICHQAIFYPATIFKKKKYDLTAGLLADYKYNIELWGDIFNFEYIPITIAQFEDAGASSRPDMTFENLRTSLIRQNFGWPWAFTKKIRDYLVKIK